MFRLHVVEVGQPAREGSRALDRQRTLEGGPSCGLSRLGLAGAVEVLDPEEARVAAADWAAAGLARYGR